MLCACLLPTVPELSHGGFLLPEKIFFVGVAVLSPPNKHHIMLAIPYLQKHTKAMV
jgi:hypothetical protein